MSGNGDGEDDASCRRGFVYVISKFLQNGIVSMSGCKIKAGRRQDRFRRRKESLVVLLYCQVGLEPAQ